MCRVFVLKRPRHLPSLCPFDKIVESRTNRGLDLARRAHLLLQPYRNPEYYIVLCDNSSRIANLALRPYWGADSILPAAANSLNSVLRT